MTTVAGPADHLRPPQDWRHRDPTAAIRRAGLAWAPPIDLAARNRARIDELDAELEAQS